MLDDIQRLEAKRSERREKRLQENLSADEIKELEKKDKEEDDKETIEIFNELRSSSGRKLSVEEARQKTLQFVSLLDNHLSIMVSRSRELRLVKAGVKIDRNLMMVNRSADYKSTAKTVRDIVLLSASSKSI